MTPQLSSVAALLLCMLLGACAVQTNAPPAPPAHLQTREQQAFEEAVTILKRWFVTPLDDARISATSVQDLLREVDPEAGAYLDDEAMRANASSSPDNASVGIEFRAREGSFVLAPLPDGPALKAGLLEGDVLVAVDGQPVQGLRIDHAVARVRGPAGSRVRLSVKRGQPPVNLHLDIVRAVTPPRATVAVSRADGSSVLVLRFTSFDDRTLADVAGQLTREWQQQPFRGLVLDLRGTPGGLLSTTLNLATLFLPADAVLAVSSGRMEGASETYRASRLDLLRELPASRLSALPLAARNTPLVVLVDERTAAGAELVAAALKDHRRATIVGRKTYGKASLQMIVPLRHGGAINFTTAYWLSPSGGSLHRQGVTPDVTVESRDAADELAQAVCALTQARALLTPVQ